MSNMDSRLTPSRRPLTAADLGRPPRGNAPALNGIEKFAECMSQAVGLGLSATAASAWQVSFDRMSNGHRAEAGGDGRWFRVESRAGSMTFFMSMDRTVLSAVCDAAMGGGGAETPFEFSDRPISRIERELLQLVYSRIENRVVSALSDFLSTPVSLFDGVLDGSSNSGSERPLGFCFLVNLFGYSGELWTFASHDELAIQFDAAGLSGGGAQLILDRTRELQRQIGSADVEIVASLAPETLLVEEIASFTPGKLVRLATSMCMPVILSIGGVPAFTGTLARSGDRLALQVLKPLT